MAKSGEGDSCSTCANELLKKECLRGDWTWQDNNCSGWEPKTKESGEIRATVKEDTGTGRQIFISINEKHFVIDCYCCFERQEPTKEQAQSIADKINRPDPLKIVEEVIDQMIKEYKMVRKKNHAQDYVVLCSGGIEALKELKTKLKGIEEGKQNGN